MKLVDKRKIYKCGNKYKTLEDVSTWEKYFQADKESLLRRVGMACLVINIIYSIKETLSLIDEHQGQP